MIFTICSHSSPNTVESETKVEEMAQNVAHMRNVRDKLTL